MISIDNLQVKLGKFVLKDICLNIKNGEYFIILGPTGAGKTVLLEAIAGLNPVCSGTICVNGDDITKLRPEKRGIGIVYQDQALFPHLSVQQNIAFGLKMQKYSKKEVESRLNDVIDLLNIGHLRQRNTETLSGGERQKVALARALATNPNVLLLDEPLSAVDVATREMMQQELAEIQRGLKVTIVHVTHDFDEAIALADRIAIFNEGRIVQVGTSEEVFRHPESEFVARFAMSRNVFTGEAGDHDDGSASINVDGTKIVATTRLQGKVHLSLRSEDVIISHEPLRSTARNSFQGKITHIANRGAVVYVTVSVPPDFVCLVTHRSFEDLDLRVDAMVWITFKASAVHVF